MGTPTSKIKPKPNWLIKHRDRSLENKNYRRCKKYYDALYEAWPKWADSNLMKQIYREAHERRRKGEDVQVDHIIPIISKYVCGLHCEQNLRIIDRKANHAKSNQIWENSWNEQLAFDFESRKS